MQHPVSWGQYIDYLISHINVEAAERSAAAIIALAH
jgi:hypothetical protein